MGEVIGTLGRPRGRQVGVIVASHHRLSEKQIASARDGDPNAVYLQAVQAIYAVTNDALVFPTCQPISGSAVEEIVFARALPNEMPSILRIYPDGTFPMSIGGVESTSVFFVKRSLPVRHGVFVVTLGRRHETNTVQCTIGR